MTRNPFRPLMQVALATFLLAGCSGLGPARLLAGAVHHRESPDNTRRPFH
jgi:hypothetical protein